MNKKSFAELLGVKDGIVLPSSKFSIGGQFGVRVNDGEWEFNHNLVVNEGLDDILNVYLQGGTQKLNWYIAPWSNNVTPASSWTASNFATTAGEFTGYTQTTRQQWTPAAEANQSTSNVASPATFTINTATTIYGAAMLSSSAKSDTSGKLLSAFQFTNPRPFQPNDTMQIAYFIGAQSA